MHKSAIFPEVTQRAKERRGPEHVYDAIDGRKSALVVIDMQNNWVMAGQPGYAAGCVDIVPNINRLAQALRAAGGLVVWVQMDGSPKAQSDWQRFRDFFPGEELFRRWVEALTPGGVGFELWAGLDAKPEDPRVVKTRYSAFIQGSSGLEAMLRERGLDTVIVVGTATNVCCESTARDANMLNFKTIMVSDGNATRSDAEHNATLSNLFGLFADVMTTDEIVARLGRQKAGLSQAAE